MKDKLYKGGARDKILGWSGELGFDLAGIAPLSEGALAEAGARLQRHLKQGHHAEMAWMARRERQHPLLLWPQAKSAIVLGADYRPDYDPLDLLQHKHIGAISVYAAGEDYHKKLGTKLKQLAKKISGDLQCEAKSFIDTAALMEKPLAALGGIGWQGKHTNLVSRRLGSWFFFRRRLNRYRPAL